MREDSNSIGKYWCLPEKDVGTRKGEYQHGRKSN